MTEPNTKPVDEKFRPNDATADGWLWWAKLSVMLSVAGIVLAVAFYIAGIALYFSNFNFGSGGDSRGAALVWVGVILGLSTIAIDAVGIVTGYFVGRSSRRWRWLLISAGLAVVKSVAILLPIMR